MRCGICYQELGSLSEEKKLRLEIAVLEETVEQWETDLFEAQRELARVREELATCKSERDELLRRAKE